ncbi:MAG: glutathione S-transferase family protein [Pseudomonadota bacterium]
MTIKVHGTIMSPWVTRLLATLEEKGLTYEIVNVVPMGQPDPEFLKISPLGKVPVLEIDGKFMPDSLAACTYLERKVPEPSLFPKDDWNAGWMLWLCDYLGTGLFSKVEAPLFIQRFINPVFLKQEPDQSVIDDALNAMPAFYDYLNSQLDHGSAFFLGDEFQLVDLTAGSIFINLRHAEETVDKNRWPHLAAFVDRIHTRASFTSILDRQRETLGTVSPMFAN